MPPLAARNVSRTSDPAARSPRTWGRSPDELRRLSPRRPLTARRWHGSPRAARGQVHALIAVLGEWLFEALPQWSIVIGNLLSAAAMLGVFFRRHRVAWREFLLADE
ncbi:MAG: hypothetical protein DMD83_19535 [Candidatus Rokuibacteriota bacterium]|nr:MAG: hypothetical protein DMD83_19535 [Candidatus Rokubacteria bacterium]